MGGSLVGWLVGWLVRSLSVAGWLVVGLMLRWPATVGGADTGWQRRAQRNRGWEGGVTGRSMPPTPDGPSPSTVGRSPGGGLSARTATGPRDANVREPTRG